MFISVYYWLKGMVINFFHLFRFEIPEPSQLDVDASEQELQQARDELKRFRKEYIKPVQFR